MNPTRYLALLTAICIFIVAYLVGAAEKPTSKVAGWLLSFNSFGRVKIGMTVAEAEKILNFTLQPDREAHPDECHYVINEQRIPGLHFMVVGDKIVRIDVSVENYQTDAGARVGLSEEQIKKLYPSLEVSADPYRAGGHYLSVSDKSRQYGMIFSTDGNMVRSFRVGQYGEVQWIEGCE